MATVTPPPRRPGRNLKQDHSRIKSPLARLRKYISGYVSIEGAAFVGLFLAACFWIGMVIDYGFFKLFTLDWVQELPRWFRAGVLGGLGVTLVGLVVYKAVMRLIRQFSDASMALVLERRLPRVLGDRLITAVELHDPEEAARVGYSPDLVRETIHDAAEAVETVPVKGVFDWSRLVKMGGKFVLLSLGLYVLVAAGFCAVRAIDPPDDNAPVTAGITDLNDVTQIWFERNILLRNTIWPCKSYIETLPWTITDKEGNKETTSAPRIAKDPAPPALRVRAWKYVIADDDREAAPEGWRLLTWDDLSSKELDIDSVPDALP